MKQLTHLSLAQSELTEGRLRVLLERGGLKNIRYLDLSRNPSLERARLQDVRSCLHEDVVVLGVPSLAGKQPEHWTALMRS